MLYQAIKHLKTKSKLLGKFPSLVEAVQEIRATGAQFTGFSYIGGFPTFRDENGKTYSVQGSVQGLGIVCSIPDTELKAFSF